MVWEPLEAHVYVFYMFGRLLDAHLYVFYVSWRLWEAHLYVFYVSGKLLGGARFPGVKSPGGSPFLRT